MGLSPNLPVELGVGSRQVKTRVIRLLGNNEVYLDAIPELESELTPPPGSRVELAWLEDDRRFYQQGQVVDILDPLPIILLRMEGEPVHQELRSYPRIKVAVPLEYALTRQAAWSLTTTLDLSAGGLRFPSAFEVWPGLHLRLRLRLDGEVWPLVGAVVRCASKPAEWRGRLQWETAVRFLAPSPAARAAIGRFVEREVARQQRGRSSSRSRSGR
ncbi:MAG: PilZ domain-containing protein [Firmicutes bacterium]|nr:PilZ domain-containing protein [Alicyclobacillaceae bacterium]MCL6497292.1 PilZ domain-containing protein [Bacillota bacterium]